MTFYAGTLADYGNATVISLANELEKALLALMPEAVKGDVAQRKRFILAVAQGIITHINQHIQAQVGDMLLKASSKIVVQAPTIELATDATHAAVLGDELTNYLARIRSVFNGHSHTGGGGGPDSSLEEMPADLLSTKVKLG